MLRAVLAWMLKQVACVNEAITEANINFEVDVDTDPISQSLSHPL